MKLSIYKIHVHVMFISVKQTYFECFKTQRQVSFSNPSKSMLLPLKILQLCWIVMTAQWFWQYCLTVRPSVELLYLTKDSIYQASVLHMGHWSSYYFNHIIIRYSLSWDSIFTWCDQVFEAWSCYNCVIQPILASTNIPRHTCSCFDLLKKRKYDSKN